MRLGRTTVVAGVSATVAKPDTKSPNAGRLGLHALSHLAAAEACIATGGLRAAIGRSAVPFARSQGFRSNCRRCVALRSEQARQPSVPNGPRDRDNVECAAAPLTRHKSDAVTYERSNGEVLAEPGRSAIASNRRVFACTMHPLRPSSSNACSCLQVQRERATAASPISRVPKRRP